MNDEKDSSSSDSEAGSAPTKAPYRQASIRFIRGIREILLIEGYGGLVENVDDLINRYALEQSSELTNQTKP